MKLSRRGMIRMRDAGDERDDGLQMSDADDHDGVPLVDV